MTSLNRLFTVGEQLSEVLRQHKGMDRKARRWQKALALFVEVGLPNPEKGCINIRTIYRAAAAARDDCHGDGCEPKLLIATSQPRHLM